MNSIFVSVLAFLLMIFPGCNYLQIQYQAATYDRVAIQSSIVSAIETQDIASLEAMMCQKIKENVTYLPDKISALINAIDGKIGELEWRGTGSKDSSVNGRISYEGWACTFETSTGHSYRIDVSWVVIDTRAPKKMGLSEILLRDKALLDDFVSGETDDPELCVLARINATS
jgi:hypothetical protein